MKRIKLSKLAAAVLSAATMPAAAPVRAQTPSAAQLRNSELEKKPLKQGANSFAESQARALVEKEGYTDVSPLVNDKDGIWRGKAKKDQNPVEVSVDFQGHVVAH